MRHLTLGLVSSFLLSGCGGEPATAAGPDYPGFADYAFLPADYAGEKFVLSKDYPTAVPDTPKPAFFATDFRKDWRSYLLQVRDYCFEGNTDVDFRVERNQVRRWYHMPWQAYGPHGREGIHGLTKEAPFAKQQLGATQTYTDAGAWAVGFYNATGAVTLGKVWQDRMQPDLSHTTAPAPGFAEGTVVFKLLFASFPADAVAAQVPSLTNPLQWQAYVEPVYLNSATKAGQREVMPVTLIQMDIMVKDARATESHGWIFGTYQYNGAVSGGPAYTNLVPVGVMWGNDPEVTDDAYTQAPPITDPAAGTRINPALTQTVINPDASELPLSHLGWNGRLNGPADNPLASCYSCHMTAEYPALSPLNPTFQAPDKIPPRGSKEWMRWFQNQPCNQPFDAGSMSCDASLQLAGAVANFHEWLAKKTGSEGAAKPGAAQAQKPVHPVLRNHHDK